MNKILVLRIQFKDDTVKEFGVVGDIQRVLTRREVGIYSEDCPYDNWIFHPSFSLFGWKP